MQVVLKVVSNSAAGRLAVIRQGRVLRVGRTSWADLSIPDDDSMADMHFSVECGPSRCILRSLTPETATLLDGDEVQEANVPDGARITAGKTEFTVALEGFVYTDETADEAAADTPEEVVDSGYRYVEIPLAVDVAANCDLDAEAKQHLQKRMTSREFVERLIDNGLVASAIVFLAAALPKREAVWWGYQVCGGDSDSLPPDQRRALDASSRWVADPSEENRRAAETAANDGGLTTAASCVAMAAFLSGGSMAPAGVADVPPADHLTGHTVACAVKFIAATGDPTKIAETQRTLLDVGVNVADGNDRWAE